MAGRKLKPLQVDHIEHEGTGMVVPLLFDRNALDFYADITGDIIRANALDDLRPKVLAKLNRSGTLDWAAGIQANREAEPYKIVPNCVSLHLERFWWARSPNGRLLRTAWDDRSEADGLFHTMTDEERLAKSGNFYVRENDERREDFHPPCWTQDYHGQRAKFMVYTPELWTLLRHVQHIIKDAKHQLHQLLDNDERLAVLVNAPALKQLMGAPSFFPGVGGLDSIRKDT